jgi:hypothetical protein
MAYTCPKCGGTGIFALQQCPRCFGHGTLIEDSQGLTVSWGGIVLGSLTSFKYGSPKVSTEDVTGLASSYKSFTGANGAATHSGMIRHLIAGDITPGTVEISWHGVGKLGDAMVGNVQTMVVTHPQNTIKFSLNGMLLGYDMTAAVNAVVEGTASFQLTGV